VNIQTVVMSRGEAPCRILSLWLSQHCPGWRYGSTDYGIDTARNQGIRRFLKEDVPNGFTHFMSIDADMVPVDETDAILTEPGELLYCGYVDREGSRGHVGNGDFGAACFRASADLLAKMPDPWFRAIEQDGRRVSCECQWFQNLASRANVKPRMVGIIGHQQTCILLPAETDLGWGILWPHNLEPR
jgi:hypothetical protein